jgi:hypothetical protein
MRTEDGESVRQGPHNGNLLIERVNYAILARGGPRGRDPDSPEAI